MRERPPALWVSRGGMASPLGCKMALPWLSPTSCLVSAVAQRPRVFVSSPAVVQPREAEPGLSLPPAGPQPCSVKAPGRWSRCHCHCHCRGQHSSEQLSVPLFCVGIGFPSRRARVLTTAEKGTGIPETGFPDPFCDGSRLTSPWLVSNLSPPSLPSPGAAEERHRQSRLHRQGGHRHGRGCLRVLQVGEV